jgi:capsular exopolysaccharide synthesis family protein
MANTNAAQPAKTLDPLLVSFVKPQSFEAEQYRRLRQRIEDMKGLHKLCVLAITSPVAGEGKTVTALNLAGALAQAPGAQVLLIDCDFRQPTIARRLGLDFDKGGWQGLLQAGGDLQQFARPFRTGLSVLCGGQSVSNTYDLLRSARLAGLLAEARRLYDFVILDTPPMIPVSDSGLLARVVDGYVVVVGANSTPRKLLAETLNLLEPESVVGLVFNRDSSPLFGYYRRQYRQYFQSYVRSVGHATP